jgi:hypothetical protein
VSYYAAGLSLRDADATLAQVKTALHEYFYTFDQTEVGSLFPPHTHTLLYTHTCIYRHIQLHTHTYTRTRACTHTQLCRAYLLCLPHPTLSSSHHRPYGLTHLLTCAYCGQFARSLAELDLEGCEAEAIVLIVSQAMDRKVRISPHPLHPPTRPHLHTHPHPPTHPHTSIHNVMHTHSPPSAQALPRETSAHTCTHACAQRRWNRLSLMTFGHTHTHTLSLSLCACVCCRTAGSPLSVWQRGCMREGA